jgi:hypothetical protein
MPDEPRIVVRPPRPSPRELLRERVAGPREEILEAPGYIPGVSTKIPPHERDELIRRRRAGEKRKALAAELGVHPATVSRAIRARLEELDEYRPQEFLEEQRRRRAENWEHYRSVWGERDRTRAEANAIDQERMAQERAQAEQMERAERVRLQRQRALERRYRLHGY